MPLTIEDTLILGYGGAGVVTISGGGSEQVLITGGAWTSAKAPSYLNAIDILPTNVTRSKMLHAEGTITDTINISFDLTDASLGIISDLFVSNAVFDITLNDGNTQVKLDECKANGITLSGSAGGIITCNIDGIAIGPPTIGAASANTFIRDQEPIGYWFSGNTDVRDWTLTMSQEASLVFPNDAQERAHYIKVARWSFQLDVTTYEAIQPHATIEIKTDSWTLKGETTSESYSFNGQSDFGMFSHSITTSADITVGAGDIILT